MALFGCCICALHARIHSISARGDCAFQGKALILSAAGLGYPQVVETLIRATTSITEGDAKVCHIASVAIVSSCFALLATDITPMRPWTCAALVAICSVSR